MRMIVCRKGLCYTERKSARLIACIWHARKKEKKYYEYGSSL